MVVVDVPKNSEPQSQVAMVWKGDFKWKDKDRQGFAMLMNILSIKARESMREEQGGVYGVSFNGNPVKYFLNQNTRLHLRGAAIRIVLQSSRKQCLDEMGKIKKNGPSEADLNKVKETLIRERETRLKENNFWISALQNFT